MHENNLTYEITSDTLLWNSFRSGKEKSFEIIYRTYVKPLFNYGTKFTNDRNLVLDCIQELFTDLYIHRKDLGETNNIKSYLFVSLKRSLIRSICKNKLYQSFPDEELPFLVSYSTEDETIAEEHHNDMMNEVSKAMRNLSPRQREAIYLRFVIGLGYEEVSQILDLNYQSIRNLVYRAVEKLRKALTGFSFFMFLFL